MIVTPRAVCVRDVIAEGFAIAISYLINMEVPPKRAQESPLGYGDPGIDSDLD